MSRINDILSGFETAIRANSTFQYANIFQREELEGDEAPDTVSVYVYPGKPRANQVSDGTVFRVYPVNVLILRKITGRALNENETDVVTQDKASDNDAMITALDTTRPAGANTISGVYQTDWIDSDLNFQQSFKHKSGEENLYRILQIWEAHTYES